MSGRQRSFCIVLSLLGAGAGILGIPAADPNRDAEPIVRPLAVLQTTPVPHDGDAADDPAIWLHPTRPELSLILGTDKRGGLISYDMEGRQLQIVSDGMRPNNVDVLYDVPLRGEKIDIAVAGCRAADSLGVKFWRIDRATRELSDVTSGNAIPVFGHTEPYGTGVYYSRISGNFYVFVNNKKGQQEQYQIKDGGTGKLAAFKVRSFKLNSQTEGCVCDDELGLVYIAEERVGIWRFGAEPDAPGQGKLIAKVGEHGLKADVEGLTLYCAAGGKGYLVASSQGNSTFKVYARDGENAFVCTIAPAKGAIKPPSDTDGIAVTNRPTSPAFSKGLFVVQDGSNPKGNQNFKLYRWVDIAGDRLIVDPAAAGDSR
jgi:3-phytase